MYLIRLIFIITLFLVPLFAYADAEQEAGGLYKFFESEEITALLLFNSAPGKYFNSITSKCQALGFTAGMSAYSDTLKGYEVGCTKIGSNDFIKTLANTGTQTGSTGNTPQSTVGTTKTTTNDGGVTGDGKNALYMNPLTRIPGVTDENTLSNISAYGVSGFINGIITLFFTIAAITSVVMIVFVGFQYVTTEKSGPNLSGLREKISSVALGVGLILSMYIIFNFINPDITKSLEILTGAQALQNSGSGTVGAPTVQTTPTTNGNTGASNTSAGTAATNITAAEGLYKEFPGYIVNDVVNSNVQANMTAYLHEIEPQCVKLTFKYKIDIRTIDSNNLTGVIGCVNAKGEIIKKGGTITTGTSGSTTFTNSSGVISPDTRKAAEGLYKEFPLADGKGVIAHVSKVKPECSKMGLNFAETQTRNLTIEVCCTELNEAGDARTCIKPGSKTTTSPTTSTATTPSTATPLENEQNAINAYRKFDDYTKANSYWNYELDCLKFGYAKKPLIALKTDSVFEVGCEKNGVLMKPSTSFGSPSN